jgi:hypothetical protein
MVISISSLAEPIGSIKQWIRPNDTTPLPTNWLICDGSTVSNAASPFNGLAVPNLSANFVRGHHSLTNSNFSADTTYYTGGTIPTGGTDSNNLSHTHTDAGHTHTDAGHTHTDSGHNHTMQDHVHGVRTTNFGGSAALTTTVISGSEVNDSSAAAAISVQGSTQLLSDTGFGSTGLGNTATGNAAIQTGHASISTGFASLNTALGATENRPVFTELLYIIKVA